MSNTTIISTVLHVAGDGRVYGWVGTANARGTFDIAWNCLFTVFICTFTMLCLNVPSYYENNWAMMRRKFFWMLVAIAGPEFVLTFASAQWGTARDSVRAFKASSYPQWTLRHGFFADMGGFLLITPDTPPFPVTSRHIHYLVTHDYLDMPDISVREMVDKSKQDTVAKMVTFFQVTYLVLQCIARASQHLTITTMELSALAIVVCSIMTSFCWWHKPADVQTPLKLCLKDGATVAGIRQDAGGRAMKEWKQTPLDFVDDLLPSWALNVQVFMKMPTGPHERPLPRFGNDRFPNLKGWQEIILCIGTLLYAAIHLFGWNFNFPTHTELILWRLSSMFLFVNTIAFWVFETTSAWWRAGRLQRWLYKLFWPSRLRDLEARLQETQHQGDTKQLPLKFEFWSIFPLACTYAVARLYLIVEAFVGLRTVEQSAYFDVDWTVYVPHF